MTSMGGRCFFGGLSRHLFQFMDSTKEVPIMTAFCFGIGVDTARFGHHVSFLDQEKRTAAKPFHFKEDQQGYQQLHDALLLLQKKSQDAWLYIRIDAAGLYANNLLTFLHSLRLPRTSISVGKPSTNKAYCDVHYDKRKADPIESLACARFAVVERPDAVEPTDPRFATLRNVVAALEALATDKTRLINQLHALLAQSFPELAVYVKDISKGFCLSLLEKYPTAKTLAEASASELELRLCDRPPRSRLLASSTRYKAISSRAKSKPSKLARLDMPRL